MNDSPPPSFFQRLSHRVRERSQVWRLLRWLWRLVFNRRTGWALVVLLSLVTLYWQWENWRSARELRAAHQRMVERYGSDQPTQAMEPLVPDELNFCATPVFQSWWRDAAPGSNDPSYQPPEQGLVPLGFTPLKTIEGRDGAPETLNLAGWAASRQAEGRPLPAGETPAQVLARELGDGNGLLPQLAVGNARPHSRLKPQLRARWETAKHSPWEMGFISFHHYGDMYRQLALHLRSAALVGDREKTVRTAITALRFAEAQSGNMLPGMLSSLAAHKTTLEALHEAMEQDAWTPTGLLRLQQCLAETDDFEAYRLAMKQELMIFLWGAWLHLREHPEVLGQLDAARSQGSWSDRLFHFVMFNGPRGWHEANVAWVIQAHLDLVPAPLPDGWLDAEARHSTIRKRSKITWPNPRRLLAVTAVPNLGNIESAAARCLFDRRCLIIACALERYRLEKQSFPESLQSLQADLAAFALDDPARPAQPLGYRREGNGYLLWSAGPDAHDDAGDSTKDWLWRRR